MSDQIYKVIPNHIYGPAVVYGGTLVDNCPSVESANRIASALNELVIFGDLDWALPSVLALESIECERVMRHLAKRLRRQLDVRP